MQLIVELDAKVVMDLLLNQNTDTHEFSPLIADCRTALESFQFAHIKHIYREANRCADFLAKMGATAAEHGFSLLSCKTMALSRSLEEDCRCFCLPRVVNIN